MKTSICYKGQLSGRTVTQKGYYTSLALKIGPVFDMQEIWITLHELLNSKSYTPVKTPVSIFKYIILFNRQYIKALFSSLTYTSKSSSLAIRYLIFSNLIDLRLKWQIFGQSRVVGHFTLKLMNRSPLGSTCRTMFQLKYLYSG